MRDKKRKEYEGRDTDFASITVTGFQEIYNNWTLTEPDTWKLMHQTDLDKHIILTETMEIFNAVSEAIDEKFESLSKKTEISVDDLSELLTFLKSQHQLVKQRMDIVNQSGTKLDSISASLNERIKSAYDSVEQLKFLVLSVVDTADLDSIRLGTSPTLSATLSSSTSHSSSSATSSYISPALRSSPIYAKYLETPGLEDEKLEKSNFETAKLYIEQGNLKDLMKYLNHFSFPMLENDLTQVKSLFEDFLQQKNIDKNKSSWLANNGEDAIKAFNKFIELNPELISIENADFCITAYEELGKINKTILSAPVPKEILEALETIYNKIELAYTGR